MNEVAIVTLAIGEQHLAFWRKYCERGWRDYAQRCGYDLVPITAPLDTSPLAASRSPAWQKCLVLSQKFSAKYSQIISLDCDIVINTDEAPKITDFVAPTEIGGVISGSHIHPDLRIHLLSRLRNQRYEIDSGPRLWQEDQMLYYE